MAAGPPGPSPRSPRPSLPRPLPPLPLGHPKSRNHRPRVRQWTCRYKDLQRPIRRESAVVRRSRRGAESRLDLRREVLVPLREGLLLLLEGLHPNREGLLVLLELFLERLATRAFGTSRPVSGRNASYTTPASGPESTIVARRMVIAP